MPVHRTAAEERNNSCHLANGTGGDLQGTVQLACGELGGNPRRVKSLPTFHSSCSQPQGMLTDLHTTHPPRAPKWPASQKGQAESHVHLRSMAATVGQSDTQGKRAISTEQPQTTSLQGDRLRDTLRGSPRVCTELAGHPNLHLGTEPG